MAEKHHYLPIFYQKRWAGVDDRVCVYSKPHDEVKAVRRHPDRVGFVRDLYTIPGVEFEAASHLERRFFMQTDNDASQALASFERDPTASIDNRLRSGWSRFVMSLIHRTPEEVETFFQQVAKHVEYNERYFEENYAKLRHPSEPETFEEFMLTRPSNPAGRTAARLIQRVIDSQFLGNHFNQMNWSFIRPASGYSLLTCDRPLIMTNGMNRPDSHLALPIGPRTLFLASNQRAIVEQVVARDPDELVIFVNDRIAKQARRFVIGTDDWHLRFVSRRFGARLPSSPTETMRFPTPEEMRKLTHKDG